MTDQQQEGVGTISLDARTPASGSSTPIAALSIPLSHPAILQNPKPRNVLPKQQPRESSSKDKEKEKAHHSLGGKRRIRRWENAQFQNNPHLTRPTLHDYSPSPRPPASTSFTPPPPSALFPRSLKVPPSTLPSSSALSTQAGQYALSLKGIRKTILKATGTKRGEGGRTEEVILIIEKELRRWLIGPGLPGDYHTSSQPEVIIDPTLVLPTPAPPPSSSLNDLPDLPSRPPPPTPSAPIESPAITELSRSPSIIQWTVPDAFTRFLVHVLARWYGLLSSSYLLVGRRVTKIVRGNLLRPQVPIRPPGGMGIGGPMGGMGNLETPPGTDLSATERENTSHSELSSSEFEELDDTSSVADSEDSRWHDLDSIDGEGEGEGDTTLVPADEVLLVDDARGGSVEYLDNGTDDELSTTDDEGHHTESDMMDSIASLSLLPNPVSTPPSAAPWTSASAPLASSTSNAERRPSRTSFSRRAVVESTDGESTDTDIDISTSPNARRGMVEKEKGWEMPKESFGDFLWGPVAEE